MRHARGPRRGLAIGLVVILVLIASIGVAASSYRRTAVARQLVATQYDAQLIHLGTAAIREVAQGGVLIEAVNGPGLPAFAAAFQRGVLANAVLTPEGGALTLPPTRLRALLAATPGPEVGDVTARPLWYLPYLGRGRMRFLVTVALPTGLRRTARRLALDYEFGMHQAGDKLIVRLSQDPVGRLFQ